MGEAPLYIFIFIAIYAQVFLGMVLLEEWENIFTESENDEPEVWPEVVIAVPCWNESKTVHKTLESLLALDYPKDKLQIWAVDDGSTDNTWEILQKYERHSQVTVRTKENGGKHTVLNYVIQNSKSEVFGCLDADSYVRPDTLKNMVKLFVKDEETMAITPLMIVRDPENILQYMQTVEYNMGLIIKRILSSVGGIHVTPGPFSLFRKSVFEKIGLYKKAHHTEDMEFAFRMQKNGMKIVSATDAYVTTTTPDTIKKLYKQRLRWNQGFLQNSLDYKDMILRPQYGSAAMFTIPLGWIGMIMTLYVTFFGLYHFVVNLYKNIIIWSATGFTFHWPSLQNYFEQIYLNSNMIAILAIPIFISGLTFIIMGHRMSLHGSRNWVYIIYFILLWSFLAPFWMARSLYNTITNRSINWR
jgi:cellulose synthase/poly-beta-1,6-N-acetylglucosamine synthase-like glycosyltransferase